MRFIFLSLIGFFVIGSNSSQAAIQFVEDFDSISLIYLYKGEIVASSCRDLSVIKKISDCSVKPKTLNSRMDQVVFTNIFKALIEDFGNDPALTMAALNGDIRVQAFLKGWPEKGRPDMKEFRKALAQYSVKKEIKEFPGYVSELAELEEQIEAIEEWLKYNEDVQGDAKRELRRLLKRRVAILEAKRSVEIVGKFVSYVEQSLISKAEIFDIKNNGKSGLFYDLVNEFLKSPYFTASFAQTSPGKFVMQQEVTQSQWIKVVGVFNPSKHKRKKDCPKSHLVYEARDFSGQLVRVPLCPERPVENLKYSDVVSFIEGLNQKMGRNGSVLRFFYLPTKLEWKRGFANAEPGKANKYGLSRMAGGVREFVLGNSIGHFKKTVITVTEPKKIIKTKCKWVYKVVRDENGKEELKHVKECKKVVKIIQQPVTKEGFVADVNPSTSDKSPKVGFRLMRAAQ